MSNVQEAAGLRDAANSRNTELTGLVTDAFALLRSHPHIKATDRFLLGWSYAAAWATYAAGFLGDVSGVVAVYGEASDGDPTLYERFSAPVVLIGASGTLNSPPATSPDHPNYSATAADAGWLAIVQFLEGD